MKAFRNEKNEKNGKRTVNRISMRDRFKLLNRLSEVLTVNGDTADYKEGFSDYSIAVELNINKHTVAGSRRDVFGNFSPKPTSRLIRKGSLSEVFQSIEELRSRIRYIETQLGIDPKIFGEEKKNEDD